MEYPCSFVEYPCSFVEYPLSTQSRNAAEEAAAQHMRRSSNGRRDG